MCHVWHWFLFRSRVRARDHATNPKGGPTRRKKKQQMGREMRNGVRDHGLFILAENIPNVSRRRRTIVLDKREDRQMGWAEEKKGGVWKEERKGRMKGAPTVG